MTLLKRILTIVLGLILFTGIVLWIWLGTFSPYLNKSLEINGLKSTVNVYFDDYGIPHIYADNARDAYMAFGYIHAQDRLFQMELMRRAGKGRLSEILGPDLVEADRFFRTMGTNRKAAADVAHFDSLPDVVKTTTLAYIEGINAFIAEGKTPIEFVLLGERAAPFDVGDIYAISAYMAYTFAFALRTDPIMEQISSTLGAPYLSLFGVNSDSASVDSLGLVGTRFKQPDVIENLPLPTLQGSNNWAVAPKRSVAGSALLSNDTHIKFSAPGAWYEAHIEYPGLSLYGNFLGGIPFALVGHTRELGWGITMFENDDTDFFIERFANADSSLTICGDSTLPVTVHHERIKVKGQADVIIRIAETANGPVINEFLPIESEVPVSFCWTYTRVKNELLESFYGMNYADDIDGFRRNVARIAAPGLNIVYADVEGNIALWSAARLIVRAPNNGGKFYSRGFEPADAHRGYLPFERNPQVENPPAGYVFSANQRQPWGDPYPGYYAPSTRAIRIDSYLNSLSSIGTDDLRILLTDVVSASEAQVCKELTTLLSETRKDLNENEALILDTLKAWDGDHQLTDVAPTIYYKLLYHMLHMAMADELGEEVFDAFLSTHELLAAYPKLIANSDEPWWDDLSTPEIRENRADICRKAFGLTVSELYAAHGDDMKHWQWQYVHTIAHEHPLGKLAALKPWFNVGPFPAPGGHETVNNAGFKLNGKGKYESHFGPAMRIIIDFADVEGAVSVLPCGNSGNVKSPHYRDQAEMFVSGQFRNMLMNAGEIKTSKNHMIFKPR